MLVNFNIEITNRIYLSSTHVYINCNGLQIFDWMFFPIHINITIHISIFGFHFHRYQIISIVVSEKLDNPQLIVIFTPRVSDFYSRTVLLICFPPKLFSALDPKAASIFQSMHLIIFGIIASSFYKINW